MAQARKNAGLTQQELAARLSKPQSFIAKYEGGRAPAFENQSSQGEGEMTDDSPEEAMDTPFPITASELRDRQTMRRRKRHLSTKSEALCRLVELGLKAKK